MDRAKKLVRVFKALPSDADWMAAAKSGSAARGWYRNAVEALSTAFGPVDAPILATPNIAQMLSEDTTIRSILQAAGYGPQLDALTLELGVGDDRASRARSTRRASYTRARESQEDRSPTIADLRNARRLDRARAGDVKTFDQSAVPPAALTTENVAAWAQEVKQRAATTWSTSPSS